MNIFVLLYNIFQPHLIFFFLKVPTVWSSNDLELQMVGTPNGWNFEFQYKTYPYFIVWDIECMFDTDTSEILAELENGAKNSSYIVEKLHISENDVRNKLSYLIEHDYVKEEIKNNKS